MHTCKRIVVVDHNHVPVDHRVVLLPHVRLAVGLACREVQLLRLPGLENLVAVLQELRPQQLWLQTDSLKHDQPKRMTFWATTYY